MTECSEKIKIKNITVLSESYSSRKLRVTVKYFSKLNEDYDLFDFFINGNSFSCGINFLSESDSLIKVFSLLGEDPKNLLIFFNKLINELNVNKETYEGFSAKEIPSIYIISTTYENYFYLKKYFDELKKIAFNPDFFENFVFNRNSGNKINVMMLSTEKILQETQ